MHSRRTNIRKQNTIIMNRAHYLALRNDKHGSTRHAKHNHTSTSNDANDVKFSILMNFASISMQYFTLFSQVRRICFTTRLSHKTVQCFVCNTKDITIMIIIPYASCSSAEKLPCLGERDALGLTSSTR